MTDVSGVYRLDVTGRGRRTPLGLMRLRDGRLEGIDLRDISYDGTYRLEGQREDIVVEATMRIPPRTRLGGRAVSGPEPSEVPLALRLPITAVRGGELELAAPLDSLHGAEGVRLGPIRARFERIRDA